jgi:hypothetical protein
MNPLKLLAQDEEDLKIVSAHLQDAILRVGDLAYLPKQHRFVVMLSRFCWEDCPDAGIGARVLTGLHFDSVLKVQSQNLRQDDPEAVAVLLAIDFTSGDDGGGMVDLLLSGGGRIRLYVECIEAAMRDMSEPRPAVARPEHDLERS